MNVTAASKFVVTHVNRDGKWINSKEKRNHKSACFTKTISFVILEAPPYLKIFDISGMKFNGPLNFLTLSGPFLFIIAFLVKHQKNRVLPLYFPASPLWSKNGGYHFSYIVKFSSFSCFIVLFSSFLCWVGFRFFSFFFFHLQFQSSWVLLYLFG